MSTQGTPRSFNGTEVPNVPGLTREANPYLMRTASREGFLPASSARNTSLRPRSANPSGRAASSPALNGTRGRQRPQSAGAARPSAGTTAKQGKSRTSKPPSFIANDRRVLRFFGELVTVEGGKPDFSRGPVTREVVILYYLVDNTISATERRVNNSGMVQGPLLKRSKVYKRDGSEISPRDFRVGEVINLHGRQCFLNSVDPETRRTLRQEFDYDPGIGNTVEAQGIHAMSANGATDTDVGVPAKSYVIPQSRREATGDLNGTLNVDEMMPHTTVAEAALNGAHRESTRIAGGGNMPPVIDTRPGQRSGTMTLPGREANSPTVRAPVKLNVADMMGDTDIHKVLRFFCVYEDDRLYGERVEYVLHYYVVNDTLEVCERSDNSKRGGSFRTLLKRQRVPIPGTGTMAGQGKLMQDEEQETPRGGRRGQPPVPKDPDYVHWSDLVVGTTVHVYGRDLAIVGCDPTTAAWYENRGLRQPRLEFVPDEEEKQAQGFSADPAPYNGFGHEDDVYAMALSLEPKPAKEVISRLDRGQVLRFTARMVTQKGIDQERLFVLSFYPADSTLSVFEPPVRNSGVAGGLFLRRAKYKKFIPSREDWLARGERASLSRPIAAQDLFAGAVLPIEDPCSGHCICTLNVESSDQLTEWVLRRDEAVNSKRHPSRTGLALLAETSRRADINLRQLLEDHFSSMVQYETETVRTMAKADFEAFVRLAERRAKEHIRSGRSSDERCRIVHLTQQQLNAVAAQFEWKGLGANLGDDSASLENKNDSTAEDDVLPDDARMMVDDLLDAVVISSPRTHVEDDRLLHGLMRLPVELRVRSLLQKTYESEGAIVQMRQIFRRFDPHDTGCVPERGLVRVLEDIGVSAHVPRRDANHVFLHYEREGQMYYPLFCNNVFDASAQVDLTHSPKVPNACPTVSGMLRTVRNKSSAALLASSPKRGSRPRSGTGMRGPSSGFGNTTMTVDQLGLHKTDDQLLQQLMASFCARFSRLQRKRVLRKHLSALDPERTGKVRRAHFAHALDNTKQEFMFEWMSRDQDALLDFFFPADSVALNYELLLDILFSRDVRRARTLTDRIYERLERERARSHYNLDEDSASLSADPALRRK